MKTFQSRLQRQKDTQLTRKTIVLGVLTLLVLVLIIFVGVPLMVELAVLLGNTRNDDTKVGQDDVPPLPPRLSIPYTATASAQIGIAGMTEENTKVFLQKNGETVAETEGKEDGSFVFESVMLSQGENYFRAIAEDKAGNRSENSTEVSVVQDKEAPSLDITTPSEAVFKTEEEDFRIEGKSERGVSIRVGERVAIVNGEGEWWIVYPLQEGKNDILVRAIDEAENVSEKRIEITLLL